MHWAGAAPALHEWESPQLASPRKLHRCNKHVCCWSIYYWNFFTRSDWPGLELCDQNRRTICPWKELSDAPGFFRVMRMSGGGVWGRPKNSMWPLIGRLEMPTSSAFSSLNWGITQPHKDARSGLHPPLSPHRWSICGTKTSCITRYRSHQNNWSSLFQLKALGYRRTMVGIGPGHLSFCAHTGDFNETYFWPVWQTFHQ